MNQQIDFIDQQNKRQADEYKELKQRSEDLAFTLKGLENKLDALFHDRNYLEE